MKKISTSTLSSIKYNRGNPEKLKENNLDRIIFNIRVCRNILLENGLDFLEVK